MPGNPTTRPALDVARVRAEFPALSQTVHGRPLAYLDSAATSQKPRAVIDAVRHFYERDNSNVHRGVHALSERATAAYEGARETAARFLGSPGREGVVFVRGVTEAVNLVAHGWLRPRLRAGDEVLLTHMEHHSNIVPWQMACEAAGAKLVPCPVHDDGSLDIEAFDRLLGKRTRLVAIAHVSNALGTVNPVAELTRRAHTAGAVVLVDGAQAGSHLPVDMSAIGCDFYAISGHKMCGPTGIGVLAARPERLEEMSPWQGGGDMIRSVSFERTTWNDIPQRFEAGTPHIAGAIGLATAMDYLEGLGLETIHAHEEQLLAYQEEQLRAVEGLRVIGEAPGKIAVTSFTLDCAHPHDIATILDRQGVAVRAGHHCAQPLMERFGVPATLRSSLSVYNDRSDIDALVGGLHKVREVFAR